MKEAIARTFNLPKKRIKTEKSEKDDNNNNMIVLTVC